MWNNIAWTINCIIFMSNALKPIPFPKHRHMYIGINLSVDFAVNGVVPPLLCKLDNISTGVNILSSIRITTMEAEGMYCV